MALPSTFNARLLEMEATRQRLLQELQVEKDTLESRKNLLLKQKESLRHIQQRCLLLKQKSTEIDCKILSREDELKRDKAKLKETRFKQRDLQDEVDFLEVQQNRNAQYYDLKNKEMEMFAQRIRQFLSSLREEVDGLRKLATKSEAERPKLTEVEANKSIMEQQLTGDNVLLKKKDNNAIEISELQRKIQIMDEKLSEAMRKRNKRKRELTPILQEELISPSQYTDVCN